MGITEETTFGNLDRVASEVGNLKERANFASTRNGSLETLHQLWQANLERE
jgi:hypothetical protein